MRLLLWGLAAAALFATEPGKRLQRKAVDKFKELKGKTCGAEAQECDGQTKSEKAESVDVGANGKPSKKEEKKDEKNSEQAKRKLRAVSNDETAENEAEDELEESRTAIKDSNERHPEMGAEENEDEAEEPRLEKETEDEKAEDDQDDENSDDEADDEKAEDEKSGDEDEHGIDQKKAAELLEKLNAKPSAPEDELKSA
jgi:hypothetical protein